jgi:hypothetical protein
MAPRRILLPALAAGLVASVLAAAGCRSGDDKIKPSPLPPGYALLLRQQQSRGQGLPRTTGGQTVDEMLAVVDGEVLTRREVLRSLRLRGQNVEKPAEEEEVRQARLRWAQQRLVMGAARRAGVHIPESAIDSIAEDELERQMKANAKETGVALGRDEYLKHRHTTWQEFRDDLSGQIMEEWYLRKLYDGVGSLRPSSDKGVDPAEVRRIYFDHPQAFDEPRGVRVAILQVPISQFEKQGRDFLEAEQLADKRAQQLRKDLAAGVPVEAVVRKHGLDPSHVQIAPKGHFASPPPPGRKLPRDMRYIFDPARRPGDAIVARYPDGPAVVAVVEVRPARRRTFDDPQVYRTIVELLQAARREALGARLIKDLLGQGASVWPPELAQDLHKAADEDMERVRSHELVGKARLR